MIELVFDENSLNETAIAIRHLNSSVADNFSSISAIVDHMKRTAEDSSKQFYIATYGYVLFFTHFEENKKYVYAAIQPRVYNHIHDLED